MTRTKPVKARLTAAQMAQETTLCVVEWQGKLHCAYLNDHRIAGSKPWGGGNTAREWALTLSDVVRAFPELFNALGFDYLGAPVKAITPAPAPKRRKK